MINEKNISFSTQDKDLSKKEWLITNGIGGYASSTICGMHTRKYHGLLIASLTPPVDKFLLLSSLDEEIYIDNKCFEFATHEYKNIIHPQGFKYLKKFSFRPLPKWQYEINGIKIIKTIFMKYEENTVFIKYNINVPVEKKECFIKIHSLVNMRDFHHVIMKNENILQNSTKNGTLVYNPRDKKIHLNIFSNAKYVHDEKWYFQFKYEIEKNRGYDYIEDCFHPGYFEMNLSSGNNELFIMASVERDICSVSHVEKIHNDEISRLEQLNIHTKFKEIIPFHLIYAADNFLVKRSSTNKHSVIAGYPWFADWGRDTMIALPGLTLVTGRYEIAASILETFALNCKNGLIPNRFADNSEDHYDYNTVDASLWFIYAVWKYFQYTNDIKTVKKLWPTINEIIHYYSNGTDFGIKMDEDYLIMHDGQLTWMDVKIGDVEITPRKGKTCEINALWYNALMIATEITKKLNLNHNEFEKKATHILQNYEKMFWNEKKDCLYDYVGYDASNNEYKDDAIRPNQIFSIALPYSVIKGDKAKKIIKTVNNELLTLRGLRTLERNNKYYTPKYQGNVISRDEAYHNGTVWPWLLGFYISAYCTTHNHSVNSKIYAKKILDNFIPHLLEAGIGTISEIFDAEEPYEPKGAMAQAWSVAEILRSYVEDILQQ